MANVHTDMRGFVMGDSHMQEGDSGCPVFSLAGDLLGIAIEFDCVEPDSNDTIENRLTNVEEASCSMTHILPANVIEVAAISE